MSIQTEIERIRSNVDNTYNTISEYGADMPQTRNSDSLPGTAASIKAVLFGKEQQLTDEQKAQARQNIGAAAVGEGGGGVSSWNDLTDKPTVISGGDTLTWDGNTDGLYNVEDFFYKVSDKVVTIDDLARGFKATIDGEDGEIPAGAIAEIAEGIAFVGFAAFVAENGIGVDVDGMCFGESGIYFVKEEGVYVERITIHGYTGFGQEKIAPSHLYQPDWNQSDEAAADFIKNKPFGDTVTEIMPETEVVGVESDGLYEIPIDPDLFSHDEQSLNVTFDGDEYVCGVNTDFGVAVFGNPVFFDGDDTGEPFLIAPSFGVCLVADSEHHTLSISSVNTQKLDDKYVNKQTVFYFGIAEQIYLYSDQMLTTKVTKEQLWQAYKVGPVLIAGVYESMGYFAGVYSQPLTAEFASAEYAIIYVAINVNDTTDSMTCAKLYTAECEPTT